MSILIHWAPDDFIASMSRAKSVSDSAVRAVVRADSPKRPFEAGGGGGGGGGGDAGAAWTTALAADEADAAPALLDAVTCASTVCPTSAEARVYADDVAPEIDEQLAPAESQR